MKIFLLLVAVLAVAIARDTYRENVRRRWAQVWQQFEAIASSPSGGATEAADLAKRLAERRTLLTQRFNACTDARCRYWAHHGLARNQRELDGLVAVGKCLRKSDSLAVRTCVYTVVRRFRRGTKPGPKGRRQRQVDRWRKCRSRLVAIARLEVWRGKRRKRDFVSDMSFFFFCV